MRVYLAGPMTGYSEFNYPAFNTKAAELREQGLEVFNPAESFNGDSSLGREVYMRKDLEEILKCDAIYLLKGWEKSRGATLERLIAVELALEILNPETPATDEP